MKPQLLLAVLTVVLIAGCSGPQREQGSLPETAGSLAAGGPTTGLVLYPVRTLGRPDQNVADVLGLVLEKHGMENLRAADAVFNADASKPWEAVTTDFAAFVRQNPPAAAYALYAEYLGDPRSGPTEVRWVIASRAGDIALVDRQTPADADFKRTAARDPDPMGCSVLVAERIFSRLHWTRQTAAGQGRFARLWAEKSGTPSEQERAQMQQRLAALQKEWPSASLVVFPPLVNGRPDTESGMRLAQRLTKQLGRPVTLVDRAAAIQLAPTSNEQKRLWDLARGLRQELRTRAPAADYALIAEFLVDGEARTPRGVHLVICDHGGDWVAVDFQNDQQVEVRRLSRKGVSGCEELATQRIAAMLRR